MSIEVHSLHDYKIDDRIISCHKQMMSKHGIECNYTQEASPNHGEWMNVVMEKAKSDIVIFLDIDCVPLDTKNFHDCIKHVQESKTFLGISQVSNHISPASHTYAAPAFFVIDRSCYKKMGSPSFKAYSSGDVGEYVSYVAESMKIPYTCLYPKFYHHAPKEGLWRLGNYGYYGIGTIFDKDIFHLYQSRFSENIELFEEVCKASIDEKIVQMAFQNSRYI